MATSPNVFDQFDASAKGNVFDQFDKPAAEPPNGNADYVGAFFRPIINATTFLPGLAADTGVGLRNIGESIAQKTGLAEPIYKLNQKLAGNSQILQSILPQGAGPAAQLLTPQFNASLEQAFPKPTGVNRAAEIVNTGLAGGLMPSPQAAQQAPANFVKPVVQPRDITQQAAQEAGYVVPPSTTNPTAANKILESLGGKIATAQDAAIKNQDITNTLARRALGLPEDTPLTKEALQGLRSEAGKAYAALSKTGDISLDQQATQALDEVALKYTSSGLSKAIAGDNDIPKIVQAIKDESLNGKEAVNAIGLLRGRADAAYAQGDKELGKAYKSLSSVLEKLMERNLGGEALDAFRKARSLIAQTYSVQDALNSSTGNVVATKLANQLVNDEPLTGNLLTAARFGQSFPKAAKEVLDSGSVRNTDVILGGGAAVATGQPWYYVYPLLRQAMRAGLLSQAGQTLSRPGVAPVPPGLLTGGLTAEEQARQALFQQ